MLPKFPLIDVGRADFPILVRLIDALQEAPSLFLLRQVQEEFDDDGAVAAEVFLQIHDGTASSLPECPVADQLARNSLIAQDFGMNADNQHFLVIGAVEDTDPSARGQTARRAPEEIMTQFFGARLLETVDFAALRVDAGQDVADRAVLSGGVHCLKNQEHRIAVERIEEALQSAQIPDVRGEKLFVVLLRLVERSDARCPLLQPDRFPARKAEVFRVDFHGEYAGKRRSRLRERFRDAS